MKEIKEYLENITRLRDQEKLSYNEMIQRVEEKLHRLNRLMEIGRLVDERFRLGPFLDNCQAAVENERGHHIKKTKPKHWKEN